MRTCYDAVNPSTVPAGGDLYAGYVNGAWPSWQGLHQAHPNAVMVSIDVNGSAPWAQVADVENGDLTPAGFVAWQEQRRKLGVAQVTCYCNRSTQPQVIDALKAAGAPMPLWWIADPASAAFMYPGTVATQWGFFGGYDQSLVEDYWPWVDPVPAPPPPPAWWPGPWWNPWHHGGT